MKKDKALGIFLWAAVLLGLVAFSGWLISAHLAPRPFASAFWPCLVSSLLGTVLFVTLNIVEGGCICIICLALSLLSISVVAKFHTPPVGSYIATTAILTGFASTRILHAKLFP